MAAAPPARGVDVEDRETARAVHAANKHAIETLAAERFWKWILMPSAQFDALKKTRPKELWDAFGGAVPESAFERNKGASRVEKWRELFEAYPFWEVSGAAAASALLQRKVGCEVCARHNIKLGFLLVNADTLGKHENCDSHKACLASDAKREKEIVARIADAAAATAADAAPRAAGGAGGGSAGSATAPALAALAYSVVAAKSAATAAAATAAGVQVRIPFAPSPATEASRQAMRLMIAHAVAGGRGREGTPPSAVHSLYSRDLIELARASDVGCPVASTILGTELPAIVQLVKTEIKLAVKGCQLAIVVDGGAGVGVADGQKTMAFCFVSPELPDGFVCAGIVVLRDHETAEVQAAITRRLVVEYDLDEDNIIYLSADGAELNQATVKQLWQRKLLSKATVVAGSKVPARWGAPTRFKNLSYARCLPHALATLLNAFLAPFNDKFKMAAFLRKLRGFIKAGGGAARKRELRQWAFTACKIDFSDTRWASFIESAVYIVSNSTDDELDAAEKELQSGAAAGDKEDAAALGGPRVHALHWNSASAVIIGISEASLKRKAGVDAPPAASVETSDTSLPAQKKELLKSFASLPLFGAFHAIKAVCEDSNPENFGTSAVFKLTQGLPDYKWASKLAARERPFISAAKAAASLVSNLTLVASGSGAESTRPLVEAAVVEALARQRECCISEDMKGKSPATISAWVTDTWEPRVAEAVPAVMATLDKAVAAVRACDGLPKAKECIAAIAVSESFMLHTRPLPLPADTTKAMDFLGVPLDKRTSASYWTSVRTSWETHVDTFLWDSAGAKESSVVHAYKHWKALKARDPSFRHLADLAMRHLLRPLSSAVCERVFSFLTKLDTAQRRTMSANTLEMLLFVRANWHIIEELVKREADAIRGARKHAKAAAYAPALAEQRKRSRKSSEAVAAETTAKVLAEGAGSSRKRARESDEEESSDS